MLDNLLNSVRRGAGRVQRRGEEVAQTTRLRLEVFQLTRELDALYARLGRSYHAGADLEVLQGVQEDIRRVDEEISARERLIRELSHEAGAYGADPHGAGAGAGATPPPHMPATLVASPAPPVEAPDRLENRPRFTSGPEADLPPGTEPTVPDAMPRPHAADTPAPRPGSDPAPRGEAPGGEERR
ncbi:hypothetical protein [Deinococcus budaensis]|uniref:Uncharacterized protein n=1 Tax=Deinococcus budaensis TaxID=1665626 RepID=A0A7W8LRV7_9DEIO|nr:hypothetical protein [Deinococcus budaensis]MBB5236045.1 hypothetical protein [Deinococcus budaensis]